MLGQKERVKVQYKDAILTNSNDELRTNWVIQEDDNMLIKGTLKKTTLEKGKNFCAILWLRSLKCQHYLEQEMESITKKSYSSEIFFPALSRTRNGVNSKTDIFFNIVVSKKCPVQGFTCHILISYLWWVAESFEPNQLQAAKVENELHQCSPCPISEKNRVMKPLPEKNNQNLKRQWHFGQNVFFFFQV